MGVVTVHPQVVLFFVCSCLLMPRSADPSDMRTRNLLVTNPNSTTSNGDQTVTDNPFVRNSSGRMESFYRELDVVWISPTKVLVQHTGLAFSDAHYSGHLLYAERWGTVQVPPGHLAFVTLPFWLAHAGCHLGRAQLWVRHGLNGTWTKRLTLTACRHGVLWSLLVNATQVRLVVRGVAVAEDKIRFAASFHKWRSSPPLQKLPNGQWNCSVPSWPDFDVHFGCNLASECFGGEDEMTCRYRGHCGPKLLTIDGKCYDLVTRKSRLSWMSASLDCKVRGGHLFHPGSAKEWDAVLVALETRSRLHTWYIGLYGRTQPLPDYYRGVHLTSDGTVDFSSVIAERSTTSGPVCVHASEFEYAYPILTSSHTCLEDVTKQYICEFETPSTNRYENSPKRPPSGAIQLTNPRTPPPVPHVACPQGHITLQLLACDYYSSCWGVKDADSDQPGGAFPGSSSPGCSAPLTPLPPVFWCRAEQAAIAYSLVCDSRQDCADNSDEDFCRRRRCDHDSFTCLSEQCIPELLVCDRQRDCHDGSDEINCKIDVKRYELSEDNVSRRELGIYPGFNIRDSPSVVTYHLHNRPIVTYRATSRSYSGPNVVIQPITEGAACPETHFLCPGSQYCLPVFSRCNGFHDCPGGPDEADCWLSSVSCPGLYRCHGVAVCLHPAHLCDGQHHCPHKDDELFCRLPCPDGCTCYGHALFCPRPRPLQAGLHPWVRFLDASDSGVTPGQLTDCVLLVFLSLANCSLTRLGDLSFVNLHTLDASSNGLSQVTVDQLSQLVNLKTLILSDNPLVSGQLFADSSSALTLNAVNELQLSSTMLESIQPAMLKAFPNLRVLNVSFSSVNRLIQDSLKPVARLRVLDMRACAVTHFPRDALKGLGDLQHVRGDNFKLCCTATLPDQFNENNCRAPSDQISSCQALLRSDAYRVVLSVFVVASLCGNVFSILVRLFGFKSTRHSGFTVFILNLSLSDFLMGVYLAVVGVADRHYLGTYLWQEHAWRHSATCRLAGVLSLVSSETSAVVVCLITLDRLVALSFPLSGWRVGRRCASLLCLSAWLGCCWLAAVPLLAVTAHWRFYSQTGICIPLPTARTDFRGYDYAFGVMVVFNFVLFVVIASGQAAVYVSVVSNRMAASATTSRKSADLKIARRLLSVAVSDFLCWFPIGLLGLLASRGVAVPGEVNVALAILVLPLNSALNPFLYNINIVLENRRHLNEKRLLRDLQAKHEKVNL